MSCLSISELPAAEQAELLHSKVVSLGARRLQTPSEIVRRLLDNEQIVQSALMRRSPAIHQDDFISAMECARRALDTGQSVETAKQIAFSVADRLMVERAFDDGPNSPRAA